jgi:hypothetical protein
MNQTTPALSRWFLRNRVEITVFAAGMVAMHAIFMAKAFRETDSVTTAAAGQFGDFVGGYIGTAFLLVSVLLLYITLKSQRATASLQGFEARFFELVKMQRENAAEMHLQKTHGRRVFLKLFNELCAIASIVRRCATSTGATHSPRLVLRISYYCLFFGIGPTSTPMLKHALADVDPSFLDSVERELSREKLRGEVARQYALGYQPFEGHQSRLGHYYRHLYQVVRYVDQQSIPINKYEYVKTLRAQLTTHEQALLLVNSLCPIGQNWWSQGLLQNYRMVKNLPRHFMNPLLDVEAAGLFPKGYFEWEEVATT